MYIPRMIAPELKNALSMFPACILTGARQTGKSTLLKNELPDYAYVSFDDPLARQFAESDPIGFLQALPKQKGIIIDEIQYVPSLLPSIKMAVDQDRTPGRWVLTGSQQFHLMNHLGESLAGRAVIFDLAPFCCEELAEAKPLSDILWNGLYPEPELQPAKRDMWLRSYLQTYIERDIRQLGNVSDLRSFESVVQLCAARHGQELNIAALSRESGVAAATVKKWIGLLESCYLLFLLPPFHNNLGKRVVKSPKLYFMDSALAAYLTRQPSAEALLAGNMAGPFFEGLIVTEAIKCFFNHGRRPDLFFWRSHDGLEVDLIIQIAGQLVPVEIKCSATPKAQFAAPINQFIHTAAPFLPVEEGLLVCQTPSPAILPGNIQCIRWNQFYPWLNKKFNPE